MHRIALGLLVSTTVAAAVAPAAGQDVSRRSYAFLERQLSIEVLADAPGVLHVVRGRTGQLSITATSAGGLSEFALAGHARDRLRLVAAGGTHAEYVVTVPEHVQLHIALPGQPVGRAPHAPSARYAWDVREAGGTPAAAGRDAAPAAGDAEGDARYAPPEGDARYAPPDGTRGAVPLVYRVAEAPARLNIADLTAVRSLEIRVVGNDFGVAASRPLGLAEGSQGSNSSQLEIRVAGDPIDLVVHVPAGTRNFELSAGAVGVLTVRDGVAESRCAPLVSQRLADEQRFTLTPAAGALFCPLSRAPRAVPA